MPVCGQLTLLSTFLVQIQCLRTERDPWRKRKRPPRCRIYHTTPTVTDGGWVKTWDFGLLWWGQVASQVGEGLNKVALLCWFVYEFTGSAMMMTIVGLLQTIPPLLFGPLIGVYLDRMPKKTVMVWVDLVRTFMTFLIPALYAFNLLTLEWLYVLVFLTSIVSTVFGPALLSSIPLLVKRTELVSASADPKHQPHRHAGRAGGQRCGYRPYRCPKRAFCQRGDVSDIGRVLDADSNVRNSFWDFGLGKYCGIVGKRAA